MADFGEHANPVIWPYQGLINKKQNRRVNSIYLLEEIAVPNHFWEEIRECVLRTFEDELH